MTFQAIIGWVVVAITLSIFADIPSTNELAIAFAWLILIAVLFASGSQIFANISQLFGGNVESTGSI